MFFILGAARPRPYKSLNFDSVHRPFLFGFAGIEDRIDGRNDQQGQNG
jgi:hypothetical protein